MPIYKQTTEITNIDDLLNSVERDIEEVYFGDKNVFTVWDTYDGTLPAQYSANGNYLADYRIYGASDGVGDRTANLFDKTAKDTANGFINNSYLAVDGGVYSNSTYYISEYIEIEGISNITFAFASMPGVYTCFYNSEKQITGQYDGRIIQNIPMTVTVPSSAKYMRMSVLKSSENTVCVVEGSTAPTEYVPFGYKLDMGVRSANLFEVESNMRSSLNWALNPPFGTSARAYFINYKLSDAATQELKKGIHTCSIFEHFTDGYTPNLLVCAFSPTLTSTVTEEYRILTNQGIISAKTFDFSEWQDIYLIIGYGNGFDTESSKQQKIDELFGNWRISIVEGSIAPTEYQPYSNTTTPIYVGDEPLGEDEYISFEEQKIYRMANGVLTPTDPPVPLPALPTVNGTNIVDYAGQSAARPNEFFAKYRKQNF